MNCSICNEPDPCLLERNSLCTACSLGFVPSPKELEFPLVRMEAGLVDMREEG